MQVTWHVLFKIGILKKIATSELTILIISIRTFIGKSQQKLHGQQKLRKDSITPLPFAAQLSPHLRAGRVWSAALAFPEEPSQIIRIK